MMLKIAGGILIFFASVGIGQTIGKNREIMTGELIEVLTMLRLLKSELRYAVNELPDAFEDMSYRLEGSIGTLCANMAHLLKEEYDITFLEAWNICIENLAGYSRLNEEHLQYLKKLAGILGHMDVRSQISRIELLENEIEHVYTKEREKAVEIKKLAGQMGVLGGLFLIIIML